MIELLAPAGGMPQVDAALRFGADAVYGGMQRYGLRAFAGNFDEKTLCEAVEKIHAAGKKFYLTINILPFDEEMDGVLECARFAVKAGVDAAIVGDLGTIAMLREKVPELNIHVSTQANTLNTQTALYYHKMGCERVVLSREMTMDRIKKMHESIPASLQLEAFVHGAMCMAYSGRCMLSNYLTGRSGNRGACAQPCRWAYSVIERRENSELEYPVMEDDRGTYLFSAYDMNMIAHLPELIKSGVTSLKIEGRMKTEYYVATVVYAYRKALDLLSESEEKYRAALPSLQEELQKASHRLSNTGFYFGAPTPAAGARGFTQTKEYVAKVEDCKDGYAYLLIRNRFFVGDTLEILSPEGVHKVQVTELVNTETGESVDTMYIAGTHGRIPVDFVCGNGDYVRGENRNHKA